MFAGTGSRNDPIDLNPSPKTSQSCSENSRPSTTVYSSTKTGITSLDNESGRTRYDASSSSTDKRNVEVEYLTLLPVNSSIIDSLLASFEVENSPISSSRPVDHIVN